MKRNGKVTAQMIGGPNDGDFYSLPPGHDYLRIPIDREAFKETVPEVSVSEVWRVPLVDGKLLYYEKVKE